MAAQPQYISGDPRPIEAKFATDDNTITFAVGDFVGLLSGVLIKNGTSGNDSTFLGVCAQKKGAGSVGLGVRLFGNSSDGAIRVDTDGIFECDRDDTIALVVGDLMGLSTITANTLTKVATESISVARVVKNSPASSTRVRVKIQSKKVPAGPIS